MREAVRPESICVRMINIDFYPLLGGAQMHTLRLSRYLREQGVDVQVITRQHPGLPPREIIEGVPVYRTPILHPMKAVASLSFLYFALRQLGRERPAVQIIHSHEMLSPMSIGLINRALRGTRLVINPHRGGYLGDVWKLKNRRRITGGLRLAWARSQGDAFIALSNEISTELLSVGIPEEKIHHISLALDTDYYIPAAPEERERLRAQFGLTDGLAACFTGRLVEEKGLDVLLQAWQEVSRRHPQARLLIVGEGSQRKKLETLAAGSGLGGQVRFTGAVADTRPYLQACDLYVQSSFTEGLPVSMLEAMACGLPVVATKVGGVGDLLVDRQNGRTVRPHDAGVIVEALEEMIASPADRACFGMKGREDVVRCCAVEKVGQQYIELYTALLESRR